MKTLLHPLILGTACCCFSLSAQTYQWGKAFVGANANTMVYGYATHVAASGDAVFTSGTFEAAGNCGLIVDPSGVNVSLSGTGNIGYISSFSIDGQHQWTHAFPSSGYSFITETSSDAAGNCYILGGYIGTMDTDPGNGQELITSSGAHSYFLIKLNPAGQLVWSQSFNNQTTSFLSGAIVIRSNALYLAGSYGGTVDFDNSSNVNQLTALDNNDCFVLKLNTDGVFQWVKSYGSANNTPEAYEAVTDIAVNPNGDLLISGIFYVSGDFNPDAGETLLSTVDASDSYLLKLASNGDFVWAKASAIEGEEINSRIDFTNDGSIYHIGTTGEYTPITANEDIYIRKLNASGMLEWSHQIGGNEMEQGVSLAVDNDNHLYVSGDYSSPNVDFDPGADEFHLADPISSPRPYIARFTPEGQLDRAYSHECNIASAFGISYADGALYYTGYYFDSIDLNPGPSQQLLHATNDFASAYLVKIDTTAMPLGIANTDNSDFQLFPNPAEAQLNIQMLSPSPNTVLRLISLQGTLLCTQQFSTDVYQLDVNSLPAGSYLIELQSGERKTIRSFVKK